MKQYRKPDLKDMDLVTESLDDYKQTMLNILRRWIYEKRRDILRKRIWGWVGQQQLDWVITLSWANPNYYFPNKNRRACACDI